MKIFDTKAIVDHFGGVRSLHSILEMEGINIEGKTVQKWRERNNIPAAVVATLVQYARDNGVSFKLYKFLMEE